MPGTAMEKFLIQFLCRGARLSASSGVQGNFSVLLSTSESSDVENSIPEGDADGSNGQKFLRPYSFSDIFRAAAPGSWFAYSMISVLSWFSDPVFRGFRH